MLPRAMQPVWAFGDARGGFDGGSDCLLWKPVRAVIPGGFHSRSLCTTTSRMETTVPDHHHLVAANGARSPDLDHSAGHPCALNGVRECVDRPCVWGFTSEIGEWTDVEKHILSCEESVEDLRRCVLVHIWP